MGTLGGAYSEAAVVEQPAIALFAELGYEAVNAFHEEFGPAGTFGRERRESGKEGMRHGSIDERVTHARMVVLTVVCSVAFVGTS